MDQRVKAVEERPIKPFLVWLREEDHAKLKAVARERRSTMAATVRDLIQVAHHEEVSHEVQKR